MRIGIVDVDSHNFPNLALMKISAWFKRGGYEVEWANSLEHYNAVYMAKVFTFTRDDLQAYQADKIVQGGTGYDMAVQLPYPVEHTYPDYGLYNIHDTAYGYLTRGCPRKCPFCIVARKEGTQSVKVANINEFWSGQKKIVLLDPNILACSDWQELLNQLADTGAEVDFTQGLDARLLTDEKVKALLEVKYKVLHFAWDNADDDYTPKMLKRYAGAWGLRQDKLKVYVLTNYNSTHKQDIHRIYKLREIGYDPYVMIYNKYNAPQQTRHLQRWCNNKIIFNAEPDFAKYNPAKG
ncbi:radical SAM protein [Phascolarctobacterium faecium]|nr:radical SAM protein [Phascolarctobacterium faecium]MDM8108594.1 radical SAM protein [Phascolarctobacterium faecium]